MVYLEKRRLRREEHEEQNDGANEEEVRNRDANEEGEVGNEEEQDNNANGEEDQNHDGNVQEAGNVQEVDNGAANEEDNVGNEVANEAANGENNNNANEVELANHDVDDNIGRNLMERIEWPVQDLQRGSEWITDLMDNFTIFFGHVLTGSFYPVLHRAIGVGSAFEGWSPREEDVVYRVLIPLTPPRAHTFTLEVDTARQMPNRTFHVRVELQCTCLTELQQGGNMLCFLHQHAEALRRNQDPSLLHTLCTGSYLDVQKTTRWFYQLVRAIWPALPQSHNWHLLLLPSTRSCKFKVTNSTESFQIEMLFGVQRGDSDVFVSSESREPLTLRTAWPETFAVAEIKFFRYIDSQAPPDSLHLKCLQFFTHLQLGLCFSTYTMKTIVMHLLNTLPVSQWRRRDFVRRLLDIRECLRLCVAHKRLNHFIVGNPRLPEEIRLPPDVRMAATHNLFHHQVTDPSARSQAISEYHVLQQRFTRILNPDH
uniref:Mab-21-like HhH/H2TH-like domain-containing protein n=1 Tax=Malurus cyaneus samueli TaxID=2593467 RepID=A0A8C5TBA3_9PASS